MRGFTLSRADLDQLYEEHIRPLSDAEQLRLLERIAEGLAHHWEDRLEAADPDVAAQSPEQGAELDAVAYVEELRNDWNHLV